LNYYNYNYDYDYECDYDYDYVCDYDYDYCITGSCSHIESAVLCLTDLLQQCCM